MSANVGLTTPRGSGTSGYVQRNLSALKPRSKAQPYSEIEHLKHKQRQPDQEILEHDRRREIEVKVFELRDRLEDEGVEEDDIDEQVDALRQKLEAESAKKAPRSDTRALKGHQVHELAQAKIQESEKLRKALGISKDYEEGSHWKRQEERLRETLQRRTQDDTADAQPAPSKERSVSPSDSASSRSSR